MLLTYRKLDGSQANLRLKPISHAQPVTIGRGKEVNICLDDPKCSRVNAAIRYWDDIFVIRDVSSSNGTYLNGKKIDVAKLNPGDVIRIGNTEIMVGSDLSKSDATVIATRKVDVETDAKK